VALEAVREQETLAQISRKYGICANVIHKWKRQLLENLTRVFESDRGGDATEREAELLKKIGELTVERDFLSNGLGLYR